MTAWELWEKALVPSLLSGAGTWIGDISAAVDLCDDLQNFFWRVILKVPESCPKMALRCETKQIGMKWRIWQEKLFLARRIKNKEEETLVNKVYREGRMMGWPGLWSEVKDAFSTKYIISFVAQKHLISKAYLCMHIEQR